jgi:predicted nucleic acid-binding protein
MVYFFDSSAIVKRYVAELGSTWVIQLLDPTQRNRIYLARLTGVEVVAALTRRAQSPGAVAGDIASAIRQFRLEFATLFRLVAITPRLIARAMDLAQTHALRGYDAVQLAAALQANLRRTIPITFVAADTALNAAAAAEGLPVEDPNAHP